MHDDFSGFEYEWVAADDDGHVAYFATAGLGYAPSFLRADVAGHERVVGALLALPIRGAARASEDLPRDHPEPWKGLAERGIFGFDAEWGYYKRVYCPTRAILVAELPVELRSFFDVARLHQPEIVARFAPSEAIEPREPIRVRKVHAPA